MVVKMLSEDVPEPPVMSVGLRLTMPRAGDAATARLTLPVNPPSGVTWMLLDPELPWTIVTLVGLAVTVKSWTKTMTLVMWLSEPAAPVIVTV